VNAPHPWELAVDRACADWDELLAQRHASDPDFCQGVLLRFMAERASYSARPICPFLRPHFITRQQADYVSAKLEVFRGAVVKAKDAMLESPELFELAGLTDGERRLFAIDPGFSQIGITTRIDTFLIGDRMRFVELNAECPAGIHYAQTLERVFTETPLMREFAGRHPVSTWDAAAKLLAGLLETWREWGGRDLPRVAVVDWKEVSTRTEFDMICEHLERAGLRARFVDPRALQFDGKQLSAEGEPIDLVYRRVLTNEILAREPDCGPLIAALEAGAVCMFNSFRAKLLHKKSLFAVLHDSRISSRFTASELDVVRECVPWTRLLADSRTTGPDGSSIDLIEFAQRNRERLVLKPNDEYGGRGVVVGWNVEASVWETALEVARHDPTILQERVEVPSRPFPMLSGSELEWSPRYVDFDPYLFRGRVGGFLTRLSASSLCNVTAGGGTTPTFVLEGC
jgi:hypothetical protein